jgi:subtilisin family serine protease
MNSLRCAGLVFALAALMLAPPAAATDALDVTRTFGDGPARAATLGYTPGNALVRISDLPAARALGVVPVTPEYGFLKGDRSSLERFHAAFPNDTATFGATLRPATDIIQNTIRTSLARDLGRDGSGVLVGIVDSGIDVGHRDFLDDKGETRVEWLIDYSRVPRGVHPELEAQFGYDVSISQEAAKFLGRPWPRAGAIYARADLNALISSKGDLPRDSYGHGTHVAGIAAASALAGTRYAGVAPKAGLIIARVAASESDDSFDQEAITRGTAFSFDRAANLKKPCVVNLSLASNDGRHDGASDLERVLASLVGPALPGRALVVAAGNRGGVNDPERWLHQTVHVEEGVRARIPIKSRGGCARNYKKDPKAQTCTHDADYIATITTGFSALVVPVAGARVRVGLDSPLGRWLTPAQQNDNTHALLDFPDGVADAEVRYDGEGARINIRGTFPPGDYALTLEGTGTVEIYAEPNAAIGADFYQGKDNPPYTRLAYANRESTISSPATSPDLIAVGCSVNRADWIAVSNNRPRFVEPVWDEPGGVTELDGGIPARLGAVCTFSGAGPNTNGALKPDISAPGFGVVSSLSRQIVFGKTADGGEAPRSNFGGCPSVFDDPKSANDPNCYKIDDGHAVSSGTSMAAPVVAGVVALLLQEDPSLNQGAIRDFLQAGAQARPPDIRTFYSQAGPGVVDAFGSLRALQLAKRVENRPVDPSKSWVHLSNDYAEPGGRPITALLLAKSADGLPAVGFDQRLVAQKPDGGEVPEVRSFATLDGQTIASPPWRYRAPGLYELQLQVPSGTDGRMLVIGARLGNERVASPLAESRPIPVAKDPWLARYPVRLVGGCAAGDAPRETIPTFLAAIIVAVAALVLKRTPRKPTL